MKLRVLLGLGVVAFAAAACGDSSTGSGAAGGSGGSGGSAGGGGGVGGSAGGGGSSPAPYASYVIIGDSISDGGGTGPFFYDLLVQNDAMYPDFAGKDLTSLNPDLQVEHVAVGGAQSTNLLSQINNLPATLPGPVLVTITIGGNDMQANALAIVQGNDQMARMKFGDNLAAALALLTEPDHFGAGVEVTVLQANIYDPTSGVGDFSSCPAPLSFLPLTPSDGFFGNWNTVVADEVAAVSQTVVDAHLAFYPYPVDTAGTWYFGDCIHPNTPGHDGMRQAFWAAIEAKLGL